jgi:hypothetical protein
MTMQKRPPRGSTLFESRAALEATIDTLYLGAHDELVSDARLGRVVRQIFGLYEPGPRDERPVRPANVISLKDWLEAEVERLRGAERPPTQLRPS